MPENCSELILSEETADFLVPANSITDSFLNTFPEFCVQQISTRYSSLYVPFSFLSSKELLNYDYSVIPNLYTEMDTTPLDVSGITMLADQPILNLRGQGVIIGVIDSGIDYTHPAFLDSFGKTRILKIWDQTRNSGQPPEDIAYGFEYTREDINAALSSDEPLSIVNVTDPTGHGTFLAGVAAGSEDLINQFSGAAPLATLVVVKLKPAKNYLKRYYAFPETSIAYQENDIMLGINYIRYVALEANMPLCIFLGVGSSFGSRNGLSPLDYILNSVSFFPGCCAVVPTGNDGVSRKHFHGVVTDENTPTLMEFTVEAETEGLTLEIWGSNPAILSISIESPTGEVISRIPARLGKTEEVRLLFEQTTIFIRYELVEASAGDELIFIRMNLPTQGVWRFQVYSNQNSSPFDAYLPSYGFIQNQAYFLKPEPNTTLSNPASAANVITVSGYNTADNSFFAESGRGFTRTNAVKPDLCAPCVNITGPNLRGGYEKRSGTSAASAITAGACAQFLTWAVTYQNAPSISSNTIKSYLIRGASRREGNTYPSREWGYGTLNVYKAFTLLRNG